MVCCLMSTCSYLSGQDPIQHSVFTGYSGFWWANNISPFRYASELKPQLPDVSARGSGFGFNPAWIIPKFNLGYRRKQGRSMIEILYLYKDGGTKVSVAGPMRRLELNVGYNFLDSDKRVSVYGVAGATYFMQAVRASDDAFDRGYAINLGLEMNYDITPSIYAVASMVYSESLGNDYRTIRHLVGVGYRWPRATSHYTDVSGRLLARCCH
jgi:hypothetical protein